MKRMRFAVVGCGAVSGYLHLPSIAGLTDVAELAAVVDIDEWSLAAVGAKYPQAAAFRDYREALVGDRVEAVVIASTRPTAASWWERAFTMLTWPAGSPAASTTGSDALERASPTTRIPIIRP